MENAESILVIILSVTLTIFLIAAIAAIVAVYRLVKVLRGIAEKAQDIVDNVESASEVLKKAAGPIAVGRFMANIADMVKKRKKGGT